MTPQIRLDFSKTGRSVRIAHPSFEKPKSLRLSNADRARILDLLRQKQLRRALLTIESLLLLKGGDPDVRRSKG